MAKRNSTIPAIQVGYPDGTSKVQVDYPGLEDGWSGDKKRGVATIELAQSKRRRPAVKVRKTASPAPRLKRRK